MRPGTLAETRADPDLIAHSCTGIAYAPATAASSKYVLRDSNCGFRHYPLAPHTPSERKDRETNAGMAGLPMFPTLAGRSSLAPEAQEFHSYAINLLALMKCQPGFNASWNSAYS